MKSKVLVLLSTYNGENYLETQLETVLKQKNVDVSILIRDDGSSDSTRDIIKKYAKKHKNINYIFEDNIGYAKSFWSLIHQASINYDYYAFCDQDDIWLEDKMDAAITLLKKEDNIIPLLYTSKVVSINNSLEIINDNTFPENRVLSVYESFQRSIVPGCVFVFNNSAINLLKKYNGYMESHDWATYCIINVFGKVVYDNNSYINYRIHSNNTIGQDSKFVKIKKKIKRFFKKSTNARSKFAYDFYNTYKNLLPINLNNDIKELAYYRNNIIYKFKLIFSNKFKGLIFKFYIILNKV